jgi:hypothetical protein
MNGTQPQMPQHVVSVYKELVDGLRSMKQQQWTITNYAVLLLAAVFALAARGLNVPHFSSKLNFLITLTAVGGTCLLLRIQYDMAQSRARLDKMDETHFTDQELESTGLSRREIDGIRNQTCGSVTSKRTTRQSSSDGMPSSLVSLSERYRTGRHPAL